MSTQSASNRFWRGSNPILWGLVLSGLVLTIVACLSTQVNDVGQTIYSRFLSSSPNEMGDTLAGIFASLAFIWIVVTVFLQSAELREQRAEIAKTNDHMSAQRFEAMFFELVATMNSIVDAMDIKKEDGGAVLETGRDCFRYFYREFRDNTAGSRVYQTKEIAPYLTGYEAVFDKHRTNLGHYFRFLYNALRAIEEDPNSTLTHKKLFRALLSDDELVIIFYNCLTDRGKNMTRFAESYSLFDNLHQERLGHSDHINLLSQKCFGERK